MSGGLISRPAYLGPHRSTKNGLGGFPSVSRHPVESFKHCTDIYIAVPEVLYKILPFSTACCNDGPPGARMRQGVETFANTMTRIRD